MKRILIFSLAYYPSHVGGAEVAIKEITDRVSDVEFHLITNHFDTALPKEEVIGHVTVHRTGFGRKHATTKDTASSFFYLSKIWFIFSAAYAAYRLHKKYAFTGAWAMMSYMVLPVVLLRITGIRIPYVITLQEGDPFEHVFARAYIRPCMFFIKYGFKNAHGVQAISTFLASWARTLGFCGEVHIIPNGVSLSHFSRICTPSSREAIRAQWKVSLRDTILITTSRLVRKNGIDTVIDALAHLPASVYFVIYGTGPDEQELRARAHMCGVGDRVLFMGFISHADLPCVLKAADIFIRPSRSEGMGNSFIEAMAADVPVIGTAVGGITDFLSDARTHTDGTGYVVSSEDPDSIRETVAYMSRDSAQVREVVARAHMLVHDRFEWDRIAHELSRTLFVDLV